MNLALVTGANSCIGVAICRFLLEKHYKVIACYHENTNRICNIDDDNLILKKIDLSNETEIRNLLEKDWYNLIVNVAAYYFDDEIENITKENIMKTLEINVVSPFLISKYARMKNGKVINISSTDGIDTFNELNIPYSISKAGLNLLTRSLAYAINDTQFYALALGWVDTDSIHEINQIYLENEMKRCNQEKLITLDEIIMRINDILDNKYKSGEIIRLDGKYE